MNPIEQRIAGALGRWVGLATRHARRVAWGVAAISVLLAVYAATHLGLNTDYKLLIADHVPFRMTWQAFAEHFPTLDDALLVVVDAETPEQARESAEALAQRLERDPAAFRDVFVPGAGEFFERNGLLYQTPEDLEALVDRVAEVQPILAELGRDPSVSNLARIVQLGLEQENAEARDWPAIFDRIGNATVAAYEDFPVRVSWEDVVLMGSDLDPARRRVIVAEPVLQYDRVFAAAEPIARIRAAAEELDLTPERGVRVRVTGNPALSYEEMSNLVWDVLIAGGFSIVFICLLLYLALRSWRLVLASAATLVAGLVWTSAFAAVAVGRLNLVSIAFAVLFVGLGIDFAIHAAVHYESRRREGTPHDGAIGQAMRDVGSALAICTVTTAIGFLAFVPTDFLGVGELGLISGGGMFVAFLLTVTLFPALVQLWVRGKEDWPPAQSSFHVAGLSAAERHPRITLAIAAMVGLGSLALMPQTRFHSDIIKMRDPDTESVQTFEDLLESTETTPWQVDLMAPDLAAAQEIAARLGDLPGVERAVTLADYVPEDQEDKIEIIGDLALLLEVPSGEPSMDRLPADEQIEALGELHDFLDEKRWLEHSSSPFAASAVRLRDNLQVFLARIGQDTDKERALESLEDILLGGLPAQMQRLQRATDPSAFGQGDIPRQVSRRMLADDGSARIQVFPRENLGEPAALERFVDEVRRVEPDTTGMATHIVEFSRVTASSLREAMVISLLLVTLFLFLLWRRVAEVLLVLTPLLLGASLTCAWMVAAGLAFNFANVIVIPLLLGMGVDSGVHLVHRGLHRSDPLQPGESLTATHTARAVFYSALTTVASFGSLAFSSHRGLSSLGVLLVVGMLFTLASNLLVLPALIRVYLARRGRTGAA